MSDIEIIPTNTCPPDLAELTRRSEDFAAYASEIQLDISDGVFTQIRSWPFMNAQWGELESMASSKSLPVAKRLDYEVHLMVDDPERIGELLARAGAKRIIAHVEAFDDIALAREAFALWKGAGAHEVGLALLIDTPLLQLQEIVAECAVVQVMSIAVLGAQGASYDIRAIPRIQELHQQYPDILIAVDGGVNESNIAELVRAGARRFGVGSAISKAADPKAAYTKIKSVAESALQ